MEDRLARDVRFLKGYSIVTSGLIGVLLLGAFKDADKTTFDEIDVQRLNVVGKNGKLVVVIANSARMPGNIIAGKEHPHGSSRGGGLLFYNRDGDEAGGLIFDNSGKDTALSAFGQLSLDRYGSDQVAALRYIESPNEGWMAGLQVSHFPRGTLFDYFAALDSLDGLPATRRDSAVSDLRRRFWREGKFEVQRAFFGEAGRTALLKLHDTKGRQRIRMMVDSLDVARLEFLDEKGRIVLRLPNQRE